jgi:hypothetical protein
MQIKFENYSNLSTEGYLSKNKSRIFIVQVIVLILLKISHYDGFFLSTQRKNVFQVHFINFENYYLCVVLDRNKTVKVL